MKADEKRPNIRDINRTGEEALPLLVEKMCEHRGEPTPHMRCADGSLRCLSSELCHRDCDAKHTETIG